MITHRLEDSFWADHDRFREKSLGIADDGVQPMEKAGIGIIGTVLVGAAFQCGDVTAVTVAVNHAAIGKGSMGKFLHGHLLEIGRHAHFQKAGTVPLIQKTMPRLS